MKIIQKKSSIPSPYFSRLWRIYEVSSPLRNTNPPNYQIRKRSRTLRCHGKLSKLLHYSITLRWRYGKTPRKIIKDFLGKSHPLAKRNMQRLLSPCQIGHSPSVNLYLCRDVKPANIMLSKSHAKIGDFGFAKKKYKKLKI